MRIILSPAKKMKEDPDTLAYMGLPEFLDQTEEILAWLRSRTQEELKRLWVCNDRIVGQNVQRLAHMDLRKNLTPAVLSYEGIAYQYMAPAVFETGQFEYIQEHLRILSAFYGVLRPMDGVTPYRLEMQARAAVGVYKDLYALWGNRLYEASKEYSKCIEVCLSEEDRYITPVFCEEAGGKLVTKGTYAKMARGEMVRFMAENRIEDPSEIRSFDRLGYRFREELSSDTRYIFERVKAE